MYIDYINEAFKNLDLLTEDMFDTSPSGIDNLSRFMDEDDDVEEVRVIDADASDEDDIQDSYIGKVIINCNVCHSHVFEDKDEIVFADDGFANMEMQCPYCGETEGFTIVGEIAEFNKDSSETDDTTVDSEETSAVEPIEESLNESTSRKYKPHTMRLLRLIGSDLVNDTDLDEGILGAAGGVSAGAAGGAGLGAGIGTAIAPGVGTAIGAGIGALAGGVAGGVGGSALEDTLTSEELEEGLGSIINHAGTAAGMGTGAGIGAGAGSLLGTAIAGPVGGLIGGGIGALAGGAGGAFVGDKLTEESDDIPKDVKEDSELTEDFKEVSITTDDQRMEMTSDDSGKVSIVTEPISNTAESDMIVPVSDETEAAIIANNDAPAADTESEEGFEDIDFEDIDETTMDELGESYLKRVYENVESFKTSNVFSTETGIIVEGVIGFTSGSRKTTRFMFESADMNDAGQVRFVGTNKHLTESSEAYSLVGRIADKKLVVESLKYNYKTPDSNSVRGVVRKK